MQRKEENEKERKGEKPSQENVVIYKQKVVG